MLPATTPIMGIKITFLKILNSLQPDELVITLSPLLSGKVVFFIISMQETLATAACFHYVTNHPRARVPIRLEER